MYPQIRVQTDIPVEHEYIKLYKGILQANTPEDYTVGTHGHTHTNTHTHARFQISALYVNSN